MRTIAWPVFALLFVSAAMSVHADDPADAARKAKVEAAKKKAEEDKKAFQQRVNDAIDKGTKWLLSKQKSNGSFPAFGDNLPPNTYNPMDLGVNALVMLTLVKSGVAPDSKEVEKLKTWCLGNYANMKGLRKVLVYPASVLLMAFEAAYHEPAKEESDVKHDRYGTTVTRKKTPCKYPAAIGALVDELAKFLAKNQVLKSGGWRYPGVNAGSPAGDADMSNTVYALLGLNAAARCNTVIPIDVWNRSLEYVLKEQEKDGVDADLFVENPAWEPGLTDVQHFQSAGKRKARGWRYAPDGKDALQTGSMTTAGLGSLAIVKERLMEAGKCPPDVARKIDSAMLDGLVWLSNGFAVDQNPCIPAGGKPWHLYYLYGLERTGALTGVTYVGKHDWYREGADLILSAAKPDGHWEGQIGTMPLTDESESPVIQTCFALLFLKRATTPPTVPVTPAGVTVGGDAAPVDTRGGEPPPPPMK